MASLYWTHKAGQNLSQNKGDSLALQSLDPIRIALEGMIAIGCASFPALSGLDRLQMAHHSLHFCDLPASRTACAGADG